MNDRIKSLTEELFEALPYSAEMAKAKNTIMQALDDEYERERETLNPIQAEGMVKRHYGTLSDAAKLAGYSEEELKKMQEADCTMDNKAFAKLFKRVRRYIYIGSICTVSFIAALINLIFIKRTVLMLIPLLVYGVPAVVCAFQFWKRKQQHSYETIRLMPEALEYLKNKSDKYTKRFLNSILLVIAGIFYLIFVTAISVLKVGLRTDEAIQSIWSNSNVLELAGYIIVKNAACLIWLNGCFAVEKARLFRKNLWIVTAVSASYWAAAVSLLILLRNNVSFVYNDLYWIAAIYGIGCMIYNGLFRKVLVFQNITINKRRIAVLGTCVILTASYQVMQMDSWFLQPYISTISAVGYVPDDISYNDDTGVYTITTGKEQFKILQLTDIHLGGSAASSIKDYKALNACYDIIRFTKPDLVMVTGDLVFPMGIMSLSFNNSAPIMQFASFMRNTGIPWAFAYGNHDTEFIAKSSVEEIQNLFQSLSYKTSYNLLYPYVQPDVTGRNNQLIELRNADGSLNQALFLLDSNDYTRYKPNDYDYIHDDQVEWYAQEVGRLNTEENKTVSSLLFFHIPLQQYRTAYELYAQGSSEVTYFFGENGETMMDKVCCSDYPSKLFDTVKELGSTKAIFCGHDHYNNLSVEYEGIRLTYGMSIDYLAMPGIENATAQRGGTLITVYADSGYDIKQIRLTDIPK